MSLRIGFIKPDNGYRGGFEVLLEQLIEGLNRRGHWAELVGFSGTDRSRYIHGVQIPDAFHFWHHEYMVYADLAEKASHLVLDDFDLVIATQPPTWHADHENMIGLFFHQGRVFYDLSDDFVGSGFVDPKVHADAREAVRRTDQSAVKKVKRWLAGSQTSADRLVAYWGINESEILPYRHPVLANSLPVHDSSRVSPGTAASVGRHEWPKRSELAIAAAHRSSALTQLHLIGDGSRLTFAKHVHSELSRGASLSPATLWRNQGPASPDWQPLSTDGNSLVNFAGRVSDAERDRIVSESCALIAPALNEDYGLTALEAFAARKPLIVCSDGGGLTEFVIDGETGLVCEPTAAALAGSIDRLLDDPQLAVKLGNNGYEMGRSFTLDKALDQFEAALD